MRISTHLIQQLGIDSILEQQSKLSKTQNQLATGRRVLVPSDDPVATTQVLQLKQTIGTTEQFQANANSATNRLELEDGVLDGVTSILQRIRELTIQSNNASQTNETREFLAAEVSQRLEELLGLANTKDGTGEYLFSGTTGHTIPFSRTTGGQYIYNGDQNQRFIQIGAGRQVPDSNTGSEVFQFIRNGNGTFVAEVSAANTGTGVIDNGSVLGTFVPSLPNGYTLHFIQALPTDPITYEVLDSGGVPLGPAQPYVEGQPIVFNGAQVIVTGTPADNDTFTIKSSENQNMFQTVQDLVDALQTPINTEAQQAILNNQLSRVLADVEQAMGTMLTVRASIGSRLNAIDSQKYINEDQITQTKGVLSSIEDLDYADAVSRLNIQMAGLEAAQQTYVKVQGLSLFNYLR